MAKQAIVPSSQVRNRIAIYAPFAAPLYECGGGSSGGAEQQALMLAEAIAGRGLPIVHIVFPVRDPYTPNGVALVQRGVSRGHRRLVGKLQEASEIWHAMWQADARIYVFRTGGIELAFAAAFCKVRRRKLIFSSSAMVDFTFESIRSSRRDLALYRYAVRAADVVVVQTNDQLRRARQSFPDLRRVEQIPSFAEPAASEVTHAEAFLWIGRLADYKLPGEFVRLAQAIPEVQFRMVGIDTTRGDNDLLAQLHAAGSQLPNLEFLPRLPREEVLGLVERAIAVVSTSRTEGMPNVFLEAWARGVPVLSLHVDPDGVIEEKGIGIVAHGSPANLVVGARALSVDKELRAAMAEAARRHVQEEHAPETVAARWYQVLTELATR